MSRKKKDKIVYYTREYFRNRAAPLYRKVNDKFFFFNADLGFIKLKNESTCDLIEIDLQEYLDILNLKEDSMFYLYDSKIMEWAKQNSKSEFYEEVLDE